MERPHKMGFLGPAGTHSEAAALWLRGRLRAEAGADAPARKLVPYPDIDDVLVAVEHGEVATGLVPVENSLEGAIHVTLDMLARSDTLVVVREVIWPVHNELMAHCKAEDVRKIVSHAQPISQCRAYLEAHFPQAEIVKVASTARAAKIAAAARVEDGIAAICTARAGELYGLTLLAHEIQDNMANATRFFEVSQKGEKPQDAADKILIICQLDGSRAGSLVDVLLEFSKRGINMTRIESRPARTQLGDYIFFFDLDTDAGAAVMDEALAAVRAKCAWLKNLGGFPVLTADG
ncbi:prephenate dehydratase [Selenomonas sp.]|uniref:prephenate dehydratase n=1 Tax=Selenomonas sp. TaxID=2053611 RepID=UPI0025D097F1|nr:prephenate dehydratase [Selenomonas sp.]MCI6283399.1 prephenate dehydratase [Selenomonas sp.]